MKAAATACVPALDAPCAWFIEWLRVRRYAVATLAARTLSLRVLLVFLGEIGVVDVREVSREHVSRFQHWLAAKEYSEYTRQSHLASVRAFFAYLEKIDVIFANPCQYMTLPRIARRLPRGVLTMEEARQVLNVPDTQTLIGLRNRAILEVFYSTGLRLAELAKLEVFDVDCRNGMIRVNRGKGGKDRVVPLGAKACDYVHEYLTKVRAEWSKETREQRALWLCCNAPHGPVKAQAIEVMVRKCGQAVGLRVTPHLWRHTCATHLVANGASIATVQRQLGHKSLRTTQIYTRVAVPDLVAMHRKSHPRARRTKAVSAPAPSAPGAPTLPALPALPLAVLACGNTASLNP